MSYTVEQAAAEYERGNFGSAAEMLESIGRDAYDVVRLLAKVYLDAQDFGKAAEAALACIKLKPDDADVVRMLGRSYLEQSVDARPEDSAMLLQLAIDQFNDILVIYNPHDGVAQELKVRCVLRRDLSFDETMRGQWLRFVEHLRSDDRTAAGRTLSDLVRLVIEHAVDILTDKPRHTIRVARDFVAWITDFSRTSTIDLAAQMSEVTGTLHCLRAWAHTVEEDFTAAAAALADAVKAAPNSVDVHASGALIASLRDDQAACSAAMLTAERLVRSAHDHLCVAMAYHCLGELDQAEAWANKIDIPRLESESHRPERSGPVVKRLKQEIADDRDSGRKPDFESFARGDMKANIKGVLSAHGRTVH